MIFIGIDTGTHTGLAVWDADAQVFTKLETLGALEAMSVVQSIKDDLNGEDLMVIFEDARKRKWFGRSGIEKFQGAGSIKRDSALWEEFLDSRGFEWYAVAPKDNTTKLCARTFRQITGWQGRTSEHSRDAAMLVWKKDAAHYRLLKERKRQMKAARKMKTS